MNEHLVDGWVSNDMQIQGPGHKMSAQIPCVCLAPSLTVHQCRFVLFLKSITGRVSMQVKKKKNTANGCLKKGFTSCVKCVIFICVSSLLMLTPSGSPLRLRPQILSRRDSHTATCICHFPPDEISAALLPAFGGQPCRQTEAIQICTLTLILQTSLLYRAAQLISNKHSETL